jgi:hypothetical protein
MTQASRVWLAWVAWAMAGSATFSDDIAATTAASARQTTAVTAPGRTARPWGADSGGRSFIVSGIRSFLGGQPTPVTAVVSLTGIRLPEGVEISGNWGRIRAARAEDHPSRLNSMVEKRITTTTDKGEHIEITDAGDVIFEACIEMTMKMNVSRGAESTSRGWSASTTGDLAGLINRVRLAFALAITREPRPVLISTWQKVIIPLAGSFPSWTDPQLMAARVPTLLSSDETTSWQSWINTVMGSDLSHLSLAMTRTLRAQSERRDDSDALIDAVIAWESLFGAVSDSTLRVSASLARLLHAAGPEREKARDRYSKIYNRRSLIVHGAKRESTAQQIHQDSQDAIKAAVEAIRAILVKRPDLLALESKARSDQILMEDYSPAGPEEPPLQSARQST